MKEEQDTSTWQCAAEIAIAALNQDPTDPHNHDLLIAALDDNKLLPDDELTPFIIWFLNDWGRAIDIGTPPEILELEVRRKRAELRKINAEQTAEARKLDLLHALSSINKLEKPKEVLRRVETLFESYKAMSHSRCIEAASIRDFIEYARAADREKYFCPRVFDKLPFRSGTHSIIGARTGRGKTAALVSLANEARSLGKSVLLVTLEDTPIQLTERIILADYRSQFIAEERPFSFFSPHDWPSWTLGREGYPLPRNCLYEVVRDHNTTNEFAAELRAAFERFQDASRSGTVRIVDARGFPLDVILSTIKELRADVVLVDYIQRLPAPEKLVTQTRQVQVQQISLQLTALAAKLDSVFITAAQFNRINTRSSGGKTHQYDIFTDESFREAGDLEQDAYNAIGVGWEENKRTTERYCRVLKAREASPGDGYRKLGFDGAFSLLYPTGEEWNPPKKGKEDVKM